MTLTHDNVYSLVNLFMNGGWAVRKEQVPAFWRMDNLLPVGLNSYKIEDDRLRVSLGSNKPSTISQDFKSFATPLDFRRPALGGIYPTLPAGYETTHSRTIPGNTQLTCSFDVVRDAGDVQFRLFYTSGALTTYSAPVRVAINTDIRIVLSMFVAFTPDTVGIEMQADRTTSFSIDKIMLAVGQHSVLPYTGDPFSQVFPKGVIVLSLGDTCPLGFEELGEGDLTPLGAWETHEPGIKARKGNYPRNGTEQLGSPVHTADVSQMRPGREDFLEYEGFEGKLFTEHSDIEASTPIKVFTVSQGNPDVDAYRQHTHTLSEGGSRPLSLGLMFCKRL